MTTTATDGHRGFDQPLGLDALEPLGGPPASADMAAAADGALFLALRGSATHARGIVGAQTPDLLVQPRPAAGRHDDARFAA